MFVSSPSASKSRSFRLTPDRGDDRAVLVEATDSAGEVRPVCAGVADRPRARVDVGRDMGGRIDEVVRFVGGCPGRGRPDIIEAMYTESKQADSSDGCGVDGELD